MVIGYHVIFSAYVFWLPNDPRGSWSDFVGAWDLFLAGGKATKTEETRSVAGRSHDWQRRLAAKEVLARPAVKFNGRQARAIGNGFAEYVAKSGGFGLGVFDSPRTCTPRDRTISAGH